jgi:excisionase family DNA binding protein
MEKALLRVGEAAEFLSVSRWTIYRWLEEGRLEGTKLGRGSVRVFSCSLNKLVEQNRTDELCQDVESSRQIRSIREQASVDKFRRKA